MSIHKTRFRFKPIPTAFFAFSLLTRAPTLLRLMIRSRQHPATPGEAHAPDVYSLGILLLLLDFISHGGHVGTISTSHSAAAAASAQNQQLGGAGSSTDILLATNAGAWLSMSCLVALMAEYAHRDALFWLSVAFQAVAACIMPVTVELWLHRAAVPAFVRDCVEGVAWCVRRVGRVGRGVKGGAGAAAGSRDEESAGAPAGCRGDEGAGASAASKGDGAAAAPAASRDDEGAGASAASRDDGPAGAPTGSRGGESAGTRANSREDEDAAAQSASGDHDAAGAPTGSRDAA